MPRRNRPLLVGLHHPSVAVVSGRARRSPHCVGKRDVPGPVRLSCSRNGTCTSPGMSHCHAMRQLIAMTAGEIVIQGAAMRPPVALTPSGGQSCALGWAVVEMLLVLATSGNQSAADTRLWVENRWCGRAGTDRGGTAGREESGSAAGRLARGGGRRHRCSRSRRPLVSGSLQDTTPTDAHCVECCRLAHWADGYRDPPRQGAA